MPAPVPTPLAAALGVVPTVVEQVRRLPMRAVQLPILAISSALTGLDTARREYETLAARGEKLLARLRGTSLDEIEDRVDDAVRGTALARPYDAVEDAADNAADTMTALARRARSAPQTARRAPAAARSAVGGTARSVGERLDRAADTVENLSQSTSAEAVSGTSGDAASEAAEQAADAVTDETTTAELTQDEAPKGAPTPKATQPDDTRLDTAASASTVETVERVSGVVGGGVLGHDQLPLPDYDHMTLGSLRGRMRSLDVPQLVQLRDYEKAHADRLPIVTMLDNRIAKLVTDPAAPLSGGDPTDAHRPAAASAATRGGSKVSPTTSGPTQNPPSQGDPTNPSQPR